MILFEMMPDKWKCNSTNFFGNWDIDINYDWVGESWIRFFKIKEIESFIKQAIDDSNATQIRNNQANIDRKILNNK